MLFWEGPLIYTSSAGHLISQSGLSDVVVAVAQLVERRIVIPVVAGSSPVGHPIFPTSNQTFRSNSLRTLVRF